MPPTVVVADPGISQAHVSWQPPALDGGAPITEYTATGVNSGRSCHVGVDDGVACTVTGLPNGAQEVFVVTATNAIGTSAQSTPSSPVTPNGAVISFEQSNWSVPENSNLAYMTLIRRDDTSIPASVSYSRTSGSATPDQDFKLEPGVVNFAPGETSKTIAVAITNDTDREDAETIDVSLTDASSGAAVGASTSASVTIGASDQRPDALISTAASSAYVGNNVYNSSGAGQTRTLSARRTVAKAFFVRMYNDGNVANSLVLRGTAAQSGSSVAYYSGTTNVTRRMRSAAGWPVFLTAGTYKSVKVLIRPLTGARVGTFKSAAVSGTWVGDGTRYDLAKAVLKVGR